MFELARMLRDHLPAAGYIQEEDIQARVIKWIREGSEYIDELEMIRAMGYSGLNVEEFLRAFCSTEFEAIVCEFIRDENVSTAAVLEEVGEDGIREWMLQERWISCFLEPSDIGRGIEGWDIDALSELLKDVGDGYQIVPMNP